MDRPFAGPIEVKWLQIDDGSDEARWICDSPTPPRWECLGIPWDRPGVIVALGSEGFAFTAIPQGSATEAQKELVLERANWGRLVSIVTSQDQVNLNLSAWKRHRSHLRRETIREEFEPDAETRIVPIGIATFWVAGTEITGGRFLQVDGSDIATTRIDLGELELGPFDMPATIQVHRAIPVAGQVIGADGRPADGALIVVSEFLPGSAIQEAQPEHSLKRTVIEVRTNRLGHFAVPGLGMQPYEFLVLHADFGRARVIHTPDGRPLVVRLKAVSQIGGRVLRHRFPLAAMPVRIRPDLSDFATSTEPLDHLALETETGADGRFTLTLPPVGSSEIQIGTKTSGFVRRRLPPARNMPLHVDLGDLELGPSTTISATLLTTETCDLLAAGPINSSGMEVVAGDPQPNAVFVFTLPEAGRWLFTARCSGRELLLEPAFVDVPFDTPDMSVQFSITSW